MSRIVATTPRAVRGRSAARGTCSSRRSPRTPDHSVTLAERLQSPAPRRLAGALTNQLKKAARTLGVEVAVEETEDADGRTVWLDRDGIAAPLAEAILAELGGRTGA